MADDLNRPIARALSPSVTGLLARTLGERTDAARLGLRGALTAVFRALNAKSATEAGAGEVLSVVRDHQGADAGLLSGLEARLRHPDAGGLLAERSAAVDRLFSGRAPGIAAHLASFSKIKPGSASALLTLAAELVVAALSEAGVTSRGAAGLRRSLRAEEAEVRRTAPAGFDPDVGGASSPGGGGRGGWRPWMLAALAIPVLLIVLARSCSEEEPEPRPAPAPAPAEPAPASSAAPPPQAAPGTPERITLPGGAAVDLAPGTLNYELARYLASPDPAGRTFTFEALEFETGSSRLRPQAERTLETLAAIMGAYPRASVRLEGHTDEIGDAVNNQRLSDARALEAAEALLAYGVDPGRVASMGYGETRPVTSNDTRAGRAVNRRTDLTVTAK